MTIVIEVGLVVRGIFVAMLGIIVYHVTMNDGVALLLMHMHGRQHAHHEHGEGGERSDNARGDRSEHW